MANAVLHWVGLVCRCHGDDAPFISGPSGMHVLKLIKLCTDHAHDYCLSRQIHAALGPQTKLNYSVRVSFTMPVCILPVAIHICILRQTDGVTW